MELVDLITEEMCSVSMSAKSKDDALIEISQFLKNSPKTEHLSTDEIIKSLRNRESLGSTGFGDGIAIPHSKMKNIDEFVVALMISKKGVDFDSLDGKKSHIFFVVLAPASKPEQHIKLLAAISRVVKSKSVRKELIASNTPTALYETFVMQLEPNRIVKKKSAKQQKLVVVVLYESEFLDDILEYFLELGISGSTVIDSVGMGGILTKVPLFASFIDFLGSNKNYSKTILSIINEDLLETVVEGIEDIIGDLDKRSGAMVFSIDVSFAKGSMENL
ncbi:MAG: PTS sugar transporter subunit IIA [Spirochaetota bacterium]